MTWCIRITRGMVDEIRTDLRRPHAFAAERVGFLLARAGNQTGAEWVVLPLTYQPVLDEHYMDDPKVGARVGSDAIRAVMQTLLQHGLTALHVHMHEHAGRPRFSRVDLANYPALISGFRNVAPRVAHGALLLSEDSCDALVWLPGSDQLLGGGRIVVVGRPTGFFDGGELYG
jgi:hypothetical protein